MTISTARLAAGALGAIGLPVWLAAQAPRGLPATPASGTAVVAGVVLLGDTALPAGRARVTLTTANLFGGRATVANDDGQFVFTNLSAGRYTLTVHKDGYVTTRYGAPRTGAAPVEVVVGVARRIEGLVVRLARGAVITGQVVDRHGGPCADVRVAVTRVRTVNAERRIEAPSIAVQTDDRGVYRFYGLPAGDYVVFAVPQESPGFRPVSEREVLEALQRLTTPNRLVPVTPIGATPAPTPSVADAAFAPVYYPGTTVPGSAAVVTVSAGDERSGVDIALFPVRAGTIEGTVIDPGGRRHESSGLIVLTPAVRPDTPAVQSRSTDAIPSALGGRFIFAGVVPGQYSATMVVRVPNPGGTAGPGVAAPAQTLWARSDVTISGGDVAALSLILQPCLTLAGRVVLARAGSRSGLPGDGARARVVAESLRPDSGTVIRRESVSIAADGRFSLSSLVPGRYRFSAEYVEPAGPAWIVRSAVLDGQDAADSPIDVKPGSAPGELVVTMTDWPAEITGMLVDSAGRPSTGYAVVLFSADRTHWIPGSRRQVSVRPGSDGRFAVRNLPPGEYRLATVTDMEPSDLTDPAFFDARLRASVAVTLADGDRHALALTVR